MIPPKRAANDAKVSNPICPFAGRSELLVLSEGACHSEPQAKNPRLVIEPESCGSFANARDDTLCGLGLAEFSTFARCHMRGVVWVTSMTHGDRRA